MKNLTLLINDIDWLNKELEEYLLTQEGINNCKVNPEDNEINIIYDSKITNITIIKNHIYLFLSITNGSSIIAFDKHSNNELCKYKIIIEDLCCEYCLMGMIEELLETMGIEKASSDFDYRNKVNVSIDIEYDKSLIKLEEIKEIEKELNE